MYDAMMAETVNPVMLVVAEDIGDASEDGDILRSSELAGGKYADAVLVVHSK
jgi:type III restriction enzyme